MSLVGEIQDAITLELIHQEDWQQRKDSLSERDLNLAKLYKFKAANGSLLRITNSNGELEKVYLGYEKKEDPRNLFRAFASASNKLSSYEIQLEGSFSKEELEQMYLGWELANYSFPKSSKVKKTAKLLATDFDLVSFVNHQCESISLARDLVNFPNNQMHPQDLAEVTKKIASDAGAEIHIIEANELEKDFPTIHAVGRGAKHQPKLIELSWGNESDPLVCIVGKGVCFDTGGYNLKPSSGIRNMKKDMGGSAVALGLSQLIMKEQLPIRLKLLIPAVENMVSDNAFLPGDIIKTRKGIQVEIDNTDAEGRLILCDALAYASEMEPDLIIDFATLTGACRAALGQDLPGFFTDNDTLASDLEKASQQVRDPLWRLPLWQGYLKKLDSDVADLVNSDNGGLAGASTAALFLREFVANPENWIHLDIFAWRNNSAPGQPKGGEANALRAVFQMLKTRFKK